MLQVSAIRTSNSGLISHPCRQFTLVQTHVFPRFSFALRKIFVDLRDCITYQICPYEHISAWFLDTSGNRCDTGHCGCNKEPTTPRAPGPNPRGRAAPLGPMVPRHHLGRTRNFRALRQLATPVRQLTSYFWGLYSLLVGILSRILGE